MRRLLVCLALVFAPLASNAPNAPNAPNTPNAPDGPNGPNGPNNALPPTLRAYLKGAGFTERDYQLLEAGHPAARIIDTAEHDQLGVVAVIRVNASPSRFAAAYHDIVTFESGKGVLAMGLISTPPAASDFASLVLPSSDIDDLKDCRSGDCSINLSSTAIARLRASGINWSGPDVQTTARGFVQQMLATYVEAYQRLGNSALVVYHDVTPPMPIGPRTPQLFADATLLSGLPPIANYFTRYRQEPLADGVEEFFYWQVVTFGMKPVTRVNHVLMTPLMVDDRQGFLLVSRMIYASHYFRDGLEVRYIVPADHSTAPRASYLLCISRSHSESLTGFKGFLIGGTVRRRVRDSMSRYAADVRQTIETGR
jgi:hypothetical protein